jgi:hypothetical protein
MPDASEQKLIQQIATARSVRVRTWPVTLIGLLLLLQAAGLFTIGAFHISFVDITWRLTPQDFLVDIPIGLRGSLFIGLGLLALLAAIAFFRVWTSGWLLAVLVQGFSLSVAIVLYFLEKHFYIYLIMAFGIFMVLYLNHPEVLISFKTKPAVKEWGGIDEF